MFRNVIENKIQFNYFLLSNFTLKPLVACTKGNFLQNTKNNLSAFREREHSVQFKT